MSGIRNKTFLINRLSFMKCTVTLYVECVGITSNNSFQEK